jgi:hypothetical protein
MFYHLDILQKKKKPSRSFSQCKTTNNLTVSNNDFYKI